MSLLTPLGMLKRVKAEAEGWDAISKNQNFTNGFRTAARRAFQDFRALQADIEAELEAEAEALIVAGHEPVLGLA